METFTNYLLNGGWVLIFDILVIIAISVGLLLFLKRRNSLKLAIVYAVYGLIHFAVILTVTLTQKHYFYLTHKIMMGGWIFLIVAFCVVFQQDLKAFFGKFGTRGDKKDQYSTGAKSDDDLREAASEIVKACQTMSKNDIGALIVLVPNNVPSHVLDTGTFINAQVSSGLLQSIFNTRAPLHDGAVIIKDNRILSAGCFLPISQKLDISKDLGTRHRAGIGITEESDVMVIVVSEETGVISTVRNGHIDRYMTPEKLLEFIESCYGINYIKRTKNKREKN